MVQNLKDLEKLLKLCRRQGVTEINLGAVSFKLGDLPPEKDKSADNIIEEVDDQWANFPVGDLTNDQLAYYSSGGTPENDPFRTDKQ
jgi:hypothetical protein